MDAKLRISRSVLGAVLAVSVAGALPSMSRAEEPKKDAPANLLDKGLDDKTVEPAKPPEKSVAAPDAEPSGPALRPDAVKAVDDDDLTRDLTGKTQKSNSAEGKFKEVMDRMNTSAERLHKSDPGAETQETQKRIVMDLDTLIEIAKKQQQQGGSGQGDPKKQQGPKREPSKGQGSQPGKNSGGGTTSAQQESPNGPQAGSPDKSNPEIKEARTEWGNLPPRTRDQIVNGHQEEMLPAYKKQIEDYYRALAEMGKTTRENP